MVRSGKYIWVVVGFIWILGKDMTQSFGLTNEEVFSQFQFSFVTPGARATGLGGAFIGLADDATASEGNPAGLTILTKPEFASEFKYLGYDTNQIFSDEGPPDFEILRGDFENDTISSFAFLSFTTPIRPYLTFSAYRHVSVDYTSSYITDDLPCNFDPSRSGIGPDCIFPIDASVDVKVTNYGVTLAVKVADTLSLGVSPRLSRLNFSSHSTRFAIRQDVQPSSGTLISDEDAAVSANFGILLRPSKKLFVGAVYRTGPKFGIQETADPTALVSPEGFDPTRSTSQQIADLEDFTFKVPDSYGVGGAVRITDFFRITADVVRIEYEDLLEDFDLVFISTPGGIPLRTSNYAVEDGTEIHVGFEYVIPFEENLLAVRAGYYRDPDHRIKFVGIDPGQSELFPGGKDENHITFGGGMVFGEKAQVDLAVDLSDSRGAFSTSFVYRF